MLYNPVGSGIIVELEQIRVTGATVETDVIAGLALEGNVQTPTGTTPATTVTPFPLGVSPAPSPTAKAFVAATITAMPFICGLGLTIQATTQPPNGAVFETDGQIVLAPGFTLNLISTITQGTNKLVVDFVWSEWRL